jgi:hypothetical protein
MIMEYIQSNTVKIDDYVMRLLGEEHQPMICKEIPITCAGQPGGLNRFDE